MKTLQGILLGLVSLLVFYGVRQEFRAIRTTAAAEEIPDDNGQPPVPLRLLVRSGYFSPGLLEDAQAQLAVELKVTYYQGGDECQRLLDSGESWDLLLVPERVALRLDRLDLSFDINYQNIPNHRNMALGLPMAEQMGALYRCSVPLFFTAVGLGYNSRYIGSIPQKWSALFSPENPTMLRGHVGLLNDARRCLGIALIALGKSPNTRDLAEIRQAAALVKQSMSRYAVMERSANTVHGGAAFLARELERHSVLFAMITSSEMSRAMDANRALRFACPTEGTLVCIDCLIIPRSTKDHMKAEAFINFLLQPRVCARLTNESGVATTNEAATGYFEPRLYHGPVFAAPIGPQFFYLQDVGDAEALYQTAWHELADFYLANIAPALDRQVGFDLTFIESNDRK